MAIKKKGVLARPGEYRYGDTVEVKTAEELKAAVERQPILTLTRGHPRNGVPSIEEFLGTVHQKWNQEKNLVEGEFWFYEEALDEDLRKKLATDEIIPLSSGFTCKTKDGIQEGILYAHVAILQGEDPLCPLGECGVNVRQESSLQMRYEQKSELGEAPAQSEPESTPEPVVEETTTTTTTADDVVSSLQAQVEELRAQVASLSQAATTETIEPAVTETEGETKEQRQQEVIPESPAVAENIKTEPIIPMERDDSGQGITKISGGRWVSKNFPISGKKET